ncbi:hypothetical protein SSABA_v1c07030 [Spiroplasma sabaudiense Ar-1343]|uniref:Uncharacterized protein n=1 Tax=Spiroplasma sabaudiense Ar-1343 TaxID=1276257 RepID=W6AB72_9MOLU|nr:hypothetical protein [Spiroplasma sabaudiense]AHI54105.1 hypothetical protein SSABA_v1c07030 [Spiroplasma sabaudiense Ar-1343]
MSRRKLWFIVVIFITASILVVSLAFLSYGIIKQIHFNEMQYEESRSLIFDHDSEKESNLEQEDILGLPPENLVFSINEVLNFLVIQDGEKSYNYYFNLEYFKYSFIKKWLDLIPIPESSELQFEVNFKDRPTLIKVSYGKNKIYKYHWVYNLKNLKRGA